MNDTKITGVSAHYKDSTVRPQDAFPYNIKDILCVDKDGTTIRWFNFKKELSDRYFILFFFPMDFVVDVSEVLEFSRLVDEFWKEHITVVGATQDSPYAMRHWINKSREKGGIGGGVGFPLLADKNQMLASLLGCARKIGMPARTTYVVDWRGTIRYLVTQSTAVGRDVSELHRICKAFRYSDLNGSLIPSTWHRPGDETIPADYTLKQLYYKHKFSEKENLVTAPKVLGLDREENKPGSGREAATSENLYGWSKRTKDAPRATVHKKPQETKEGPQVKQENSEEENETKPAQNTGGQNPVKQEPQQNMSVGSENGGEKAPSPPSPPAEKPDPTPSSDNISLIQRRI